MKHKLFTLLLALMASVGTMFAQSGTCGDNVTWNLTDGVLTISGTGAMEDYYSYESIPWYEYIYTANSIKSVIIQEGVTHIGQYAFRNCHLLASVSLANSLTSIGGGAFSYCGKLPYVKIPSSVTNLGDRVFEGCLSMSAFEVSEANPNFCSVDGVLFDKNISTLMQYPPSKSNTTYSIPSNVVTIEEAAFWCSRNLTVVTIPNGVASIGSSAFLGCSGLTSVTIPNSVATIGRMPFVSCTNLPSIDVDPGNPYFCSIDGVLFNKNKTNLIEYPIGKAGTSYVIPDGVIILGNGAFEDCTSLISVTIPSSVESIGDFCFAYCRNLRSVTNYATLPQNIIGAGLSADTLYVPAQSLEAYKAADVWKDFGNILPIEETKDYLTIAEAVEIGMALDSMATSEETYTIEGYVINAGEFYGRYQNWYMADDVNATTSQFQAYSCYPTDGTEAFAVADGYRVRMTGKLQKYYNKSTASYLVEMTRVPATILSGLQIDTITVAQAIEIGMALDSMATSEQKYTIEGYVINAGSFNSKYKTQSWYMVDDLNATSSGFQAYSCYPIYGGDTIAVTNGSKVRMTGKLQKYYNNKFIVEMRRVPATILSLREMDTITVSEALAIGNELEVGAYTPLQYTIRGYVSSVHIPFDEQLGNQSFYIADDISSTANSNETGGFYIYCGKPVTGEAIKVGAFVEITAAIYNYRGMYIENYEQNIPVTILKEAPECVAISGSCGNNLTWELSCNGVLTISGTGEMENYNYNTIPWYEHRSVINSIIIDEGVTSIGEYAFAYCNLTSVTIPNSVTSIKGRAFESCSDLTSVTIPNSVTSIGDFAFVENGLTSVIIPNSVYSIGQAAFGSCKSLTSINVATDNQYYCSVDGVLFDKDKKTLMQFPSGKNNNSYSIPNTVTHIFNRAFVGCGNLTDLTIPNSVARIGQCAFGNCGLTTITLPIGITNIDYDTFWNCGSLTSVTIPNSVTEIKDAAFRYCINLTSVTNYATTPQEIISDVFDQVVLSDCALYVPAQSLEAYKAADVWKDFNIQALSSDTVEADFDVVYVDPSNIELQREAITLHLPAAPTIEGFTFLKWQVVAGDLEDGIFIQAVYTADEPSSAPEVYTNPANSAQKLIRNGNVYILTGDKVYTITGQKVK